MTFVPAFIQRHPMLRLVIPLIAGIATGYGLFLSGKQLFSFSLSFCLFIWAVAGVCLWISRRYAMRWLSGMAVTLFFAGVGLWTFHHQAEKIVFEFPQEEVAYRFYLTDEPETKRRSILCKGVITAGRDSVRLFPVERKVLLYLTPDSLAHSLRRGDELWVSAHIRPPANRGNPDEFDYARYLFRSGISGTAFTASGKWQKTEHKTGRTLLQRSSDLREKVLKRYRQLGFQGETLAVLSAVTLGYKQELSEDIRETYSATGASHILALSGLHIGFLYMLFYYLLVYPVRNRRWLRTTGVLLLLFLLWGFAFLTGLSPSVVRSVIMFSLLGLSLLVTGNAISLNTLAAAAFLMLLFRPFWLMDVGFQLSFCAVVAILYIQPWLYGKWRIGNVVGRYFWGLTTVSIAAQIGTLPLILFYFSRFPFWSLLTNLFVIPLVSVWIWLAVGMLLFSPFPMMQQGIAVVLRSLIDLVHYLLRQVERLPIVTWDGIHFTGWDMVLCYLLLFCGGWYIFRPRLRVLSMALFLSFCLAFSFFLQSYLNRPERSLLFYHLAPQAMIHCVGTDRSSRILPMDTVWDEKPVVRALSGYWNRLGLSAPEIIRDGYCEAGVFWKSPILRYAGKKIAVIREDSWSSREATESFVVDYLYICNGYTGSLETLLQLFPAEMVILDATLPSYLLQRFVMECENKGVNYYSISRKGSLKIVV